VGQRITHLREKFPDDADALRALKSRPPVSWVAVGMLALLFVAGRLLQSGVIDSYASESYVRAVVWTCGYHSPAGVDMPKVAAGPDLTNIAPKYLPAECKRHFWDWN